MPKFRASAIYQRLVELQYAYLEQVDAILTSMATPAERLASVEEIRRQIGCLMGEVGDRKRHIQEGMAAEALCASFAAVDKQKEKS